MDKKKAKNKMLGSGKSIIYTIKTVWEADKKCVFLTYYKNITEYIFDTFLSIYLTKLIYEFIDEGIAYSRLVVVVSIFCCIHIVVHIVSAYHAYYYRLVTPKVYRHIFSKVINKAHTIELTRYEQPDFYDKFSRSLDECLTKGMDGMLTMSNCVGDIVGAISALVMIATVDPMLILFILPSVIGSTYFSVKQNNEYLILRTEETRDKRTMEYIKRVFYEKKYAGEIRLYNIKDVLFKKHTESYMSRYDITLRHKKKMVFYNIMRTVVFLGLSTGMSYIYVSYRVKTDDINKIGAYVAMLSAIGMVTWMIKDAIKRFTDAGKYCINMNNLKDFLEYVPSEKMNGTAEVEGTLGNIEFKNVNFTYTGSDTPVINDLNLKVKKGERVALVGENGAGKTTLIKLLMGLYPVTEGELKVGGRNVNEYSMDDYHKHFGTVFQDLQIFALTLAENVLMKVPETEEERQLVVDSLEKAQFGDKLARLKDGIDSIVTKEFDDKGFVCSGGQAQKIAIARVFAKNPDIVILDEPSSALDPIAEYNMYNNMLQVSEGKTVFFISHRLSSARLADTIYFLENGHIKESGTHDELMKLNGSYAKMFSLQAQNYQDSIPEHLMNEIGQKKVMSVE